MFFFEKGHIAHTFGFTNEESINIGGAKPIPAVMIGQNSSFLKRLNIC